MPTIISRPATPTFITSTPVVETPHPVASVFGRDGDVVAIRNDYDITDIRAQGAADGDSIVLESGQCLIKTPEIANQTIQVSALSTNDILQFNGTNWTNVSFPTVISVDITAHAALTDGVHGLTDIGGGSLFLADDGIYKTITHPASPVISIFGRAGIVIAAGGDYAIADITGLTTLGPGTNFLTDDGTYKTITHPPDAVASVFGRIGTVVAANNDYTLPQINGLLDSGGGTNFLADDGAYKITPGGTTKRVVVGSSFADGTTITSTFQTIFDFTPLINFRNQVVLITIHCQGRDPGGAATFAAHFRSLIGLIIQQSAYSTGAAQSINGTERFGFTVILEGIVSATGNIQIELASESGKTYDLSNNAANGKTQLTIELV